MSPDTDALPVPKSLQQIGNIAPTPVFGATGSKPKQKSQVASFLNSDALPAPGNTGTKALIGQ